jgi:hypothetical protein
MADATQARASFFYRRRWWLILLAVLVLVRAALPEVVRRVVVSQASEQLKTRVDVGDVDLRLWRGGVALDDVAIYSPTPESPDEPPLLAWEKFAVELRYIPLLWKTAQLRTILLDAPRVALDRLADGELNLRQLVPASAPTEEQPPPEKASAESAWKMGIDRFVLRAGGIRFRDLMIHEGEPLEIAIPDISVDEVALQPGLYGEPGRARLVVKTEGGSVRIDSRLWVLDQGFALGTRVKAYRLPLRRARFYVPGVGWSELQGELDAAVDYGLAPEGKNDVRGIVRLRDVSVKVPNLAHAAFAVNRFAVRVDPVDLAAQRAHVAAIEIAGASVIVDLQSGEDVLPVLAKGGKPPAPTGGDAPAADAPPAGEVAPAAADEPTAPKDTETASAGAKPADAKPADADRAEGAAADAEPAHEPPAAAAPWHWRVDSLKVTESEVSFLQEGEQPLDIGVEATARRLADEGPPGRLDVKLAGARGGSVAVEGALRVVPPAFGGTVRMEQLPVHDLVRAARTAANLPKGLLRSASLGADLAIEAGITESGAPAERADALRVKGTVGIDGFDMAGEDPKVFAVSWKTFALPIDELEVPGVVPGAAPAPPTLPLLARLGAVRLEEPAVQVTRTATGIVLPPPYGPAPGEEPKATPAAAPEPAPAPAEPAAKSEARPVDVTIASFVLGRGRVGFADQTTKPFFAGEMKPLDLNARGIRSQGPAVERFTLAIGTPQKGKVNIAGNLSPQGGKVQVEGKEVALAPYNPYVATYTPYSLARGSSLSVKTNVAMAKGKYDTTTAITFHKLYVKGAAGDTLFKEQFGIPLSMALALLRDLQGNIKLDVPVGVDESGTTIGFGTVVAGALKSAILGAVASPLKMVGAALGGGEGEGLVEPPPIEFQTGRAVLTGKGEKQVAPLAEFLSGRPGVGVELDGVVTAADARWLAEQDLRAELEAQTGMVNAIRGLATRGSRNRILKALTERGEGEEGKLDDDDRAQLDEWLAERPAVKPDRLRKLASERQQALAAALRDQHGIQAERLTMAEAKAEPREGSPAVLIAFGAVGEDE